VDRGIIRHGYKLINKANGKPIGEIKEIQSQGENVQEAKTGERVALSMPDVIIGRNVSEGDVLETVLRERDLEGLEQVKDKLTEEERELLKEIAENNE
jgi:translation initiation factor 5B